MCINDASMKCSTDLFDVCNGQVASNVAPIVARYLTHVPVSLAKGLL